jgi:hypothetical protein
MLLASPDTAYPLFVSPHLTPVLLLCSIMQYQVIIMQYQVIIMSCG